MHKFIFLLLLITINHTSAQRLNLWEPSNEIYLFSAFHEGSEAFRYNPAVLGISHKLNFNVNLLLENYNSRIYINETDIGINLGRTALAYRNASLGYYSLDQFNLGFGFGNKTLSAGVNLEAKFVKVDRITELQYDSKYSLGLGLLYRPYEFISASLTYKSRSSPYYVKDLSGRYTIGSAIRPLGNDLLTLMFDFSLFLYRDKLFENNSLKFGLDAQIARGLYLNANYRIDNSKIISGNTFSLGLKFDFPKLGVRYTNIFSKNPEIGEIKSVNKYKSYGNLFEINYYTEKRKSLIPRKQKITEIILSGSLQDYKTEDVLFGLLGDGKRSVHEVIADIDYAAKDPSVKAIILKIYPLSTGRLEINAQIEELCSAIERFRNNRKNIVAYIPQDAGPAEYYIASYANRIVMPPEALLFYGLSIEVTNYRQFLRKYGVELQTFNAGKYKLTFQGLLDSTTEEGKEVINRMLDIVYDKMLKRISAGRNAETDEYMRDKLSMPITSKEALRLKLIDAVGWYDEAKDMAEKISGTTNILRYYNRSYWDNNWGEPDKIAIIGVYGSITPGESQAPSPLKLPIPFIGGGRSTGSETVIRQLEDAFSDPKVKAVILRIDSGGGSALASAEINSAIIRLKKKYKKPFYVSMGNAAASGGYYISVNADRIFTDDLTITGSVGVFSSRAVIDSLLKQQKIKVEIFKRGEYSDINSPVKRLSEDEIQIIQELIDYYYERFIDAICEGRKLSRDEAEKIAEGRVWLGVDAVNNKLADETGGLYEAVNYAIKNSGIGKRYKVVYYSVPGGGLFDEIVTSAVTCYFRNIISYMISGDDTELPEIKY